ncbi:HNH endonuclease [Paraglaciecola chathamensis]|uniref:HNH nuclease domain-containing protein n=1 Tax=Paraglaciecola chathamensis S18K6 TaxID=1127672 RepID=A0AAV3V4R7_9ALTE|nr:hypothetical protein [Paraglaciecola chathamensis]GAC11717.1 hypothetical protein GCHA_3787 [Paraglaciecola chathamensis S18K6]
MVDSNIKKKLIERDGLRCAVTGEKVDSPEQLSIEQIRPKSKGGSPDLDNLILIKNDLNHSIADNEHYRTKLLFDQLKERHNELSIREKEAFERENSYRMQIEKQKAQLDAYQAKLNEEQKERQSQLAKEEEQRKIMFMQQQEQLHKIEELAQKEKEEAERLQIKIFEQEKHLKKSYLQLEKEKEKYREESRKSIEQKSGEYVNDALEVLETKENQYHTISRVWAVFGAISIAAGIVILSYLGIESFNILEQKGDVSLSFLVLITFKGLIVVGLFVALAKYSFSFSQSYMHESLKSSERQHAINFGKFYLESYGVDADWAQIREAFEHWNISSNTAFCANSSNYFDPKTLESAASLIQAVSKLSLNENKPTDSGK